jgi:predicted glycosyltransferase
VQLDLAEVVWESELTPRTLAGAIDRAWRARPVRAPAIRLDGAEHSADLVARLAATPAPDLTPAPETVR